MNAMDDLQNVRDILPTLSILIAIVGIASNALSLSYFVSVIKSNNRRRHGENCVTKLFATLNVFDLLVSISASLTLITYLAENWYCYHIFLRVMLISVNTTSYLTCLLATVRAIHLVFPLYAIEWKAVSISVAACIVISAPLQFIAPIYSFPILVCLFMIVVLVNAASLVKLYLSQSFHTETKDIKRRATITVAIVSGIYCVLNIGFLVSFGASYEGFYYSLEIPRSFVFITTIILLPLNSACNPLVYLLRKEDMRSHVKSLWTRLGDCLCSIFSSGDM